MTNEFLRSLQAELALSWSNHYGADNHDPYRFGPFQGRPRSVKEVVKGLFHQLKMVGPSPFYSSVQDEYAVGLDKLFNVLSNRDRNLLVKLIAYKILGPRKVKLPLNDEKYWGHFDEVRHLSDGGDILETGFDNVGLTRFNLQGIGYPVDFYYSIPGVVTDFVLEQYAYKAGSERIVEAREGDVVLDLGGCWGDTALYFASKCGPSGHVYSFEFIPNNIQLHKKNVGLNPDLASRISLVERPVTDVADKQIFFSDRGPASRVQFSPFEGHSGSVATISVDEFVRKHNIPRIDFIKMDIEGAEQAALRGSLETIKRFRPKLAIAVYHSMDDLIKIPEWINGLGLGYKIYLDHFKIFPEETILFAKQTIV